MCNNYVALLLLQLQLYMLIFPVSLTTVLQVILYGLKVKLLFLLTMLK